MPSPYVNTTMSKWLLHNDKDPDFEAGIGDAEKSTHMYNLAYTHARTKFFIRLPDRDQMLRNSK